MPTPPSYKKVNPGRSARALPRAQLADAAALRRGRVRRDRSRPAHLDDQRRGAGADLRLAEVRGARPARSAASWPRAASASTRSQKALAESNVNLPTGTLWGPSQAFSVQATGQLDERRAYRPMIVAYRNGSPVRLDGARPRDRQRRRTTRSPPGSTNERAVVLAIQRQPGTNTRRGGRRRSTRLLPAVRGAAARLGEPRYALRPVGLDPRIGPRRPVHADARHRAGGAA